MTVSPLEGGQEGGVGTTNSQQKNMPKPKSIVNYLPDLKQKARQLRRGFVLAETILWQNLRASQMLGYKFLRQKPLGPYIVDFFCKKLKLIIEIDGISHEAKADYDQKRDKYLENLGFDVLHFRDKDILKRTKDILYGIEGWIENRQPTVQPSFQEK